MATSKGKTLFTSLLLIAAIVLLWFIYSLPVWWVSLTAPNYPEEAFPDGVRIHFHLNGVFNGCELVEKDEIQVEEVLDCVHEMDTINHYVGMYPIASGGVIEITFSLFILAMLGVMIFGFIFTKPAIRTVVLIIGFVAVAAWMGRSWYGEDGLQYHNERYIARLVGQLHQDIEDDPAAPLSAGEEIIARLKASLGEEAQADESAEQGVEKTAKQQNIDKLEEFYTSEQNRKPEAERETWTGSASQVMLWYYEKSLGRYFNNPKEIGPMVSKMTLAAHIVFWFIVAMMILLVVLGRKNRGLAYWALALLPLTLPALFVLLYAGWLGWYGHTLNDMGAFTLKPFMPTVFGQGKVAQFTTSSYPHTGFGLMMLFSACLAVAAILRRRQHHEEAS